MIFHAMHFQNNNNIFSLFLKIDSCMKEVEGQKSENSYPWVHSPNPYSG